MRHTSVGLFGFVVLFLSLVPCSARNTEYAADFFSYSWKNNKIDWKNKLRIEGFYSKNARMLCNDNNNPDGLDKTTYEKFQFDIKPQHTLYSADHDSESLVIRLGIRFKGVFGAPESGAKTGMTALHKAAFVGSFRAVQMIVATGGNVRASTKLRMTPLHALFDRYFPWVRNFRRMTPWDTLEDVLATDLIEESNFELRSKIFNLLVQEGALLDVKDCRGLTPRMMLQEWQVGQERLRVYHWC